MLVVFFALNDNTDDFVRERSLELESDIVWIVEGYLVNELLVAIKERTKLFLFQFKAFFEHQV